MKESGPHQTRWGANDYAAQTYSDIPAADGRRIQIAWMNGGKYPGMPFNQQMSIPRVFTLRTTSEGIRLFMEPIKELEACARTSTPGSRSHSRRATTSWSTFPRSYWTSRRNWN